MIKKGDYLYPSNVRIVQDLGGGFVVGSNGRRYKIESEKERKKGFTVYYAIVIFEQDVWKNIE